MEDGTVGHHCQEEGCNQKEFFSFECKPCGKFFCADHRHIVCDKAQMNPDKPIVNQETKVFCQFYNRADMTANTGQIESNAVEMCKGEGLSKCSLCSKFFCLDHRFEDQHQCEAIELRQIEETKITEEKQELMEKIKARSENEQQQKVPMKSAMFEQVTDEK